MGYEGIKKMYELIQDKIVLEKQFIDVTVIDQNNVAEELKKFK